MNSPRPFLFFAVLLSGFFLWQAWQQDYATRPAGSIGPATGTASTAAATSADVPAAALAQIGRAHV